MLEDADSFEVDGGGLLGLDVGHDMWEPEETIPLAFNWTGYCVDDVKGGELPMEWVKHARKDEMNGFAERRVYVVRPRTEALAKGAKIVGVRWVDTRKGDKVRSRLVCTDFNRDRQHNDEMFAPTPPLLASRWLVSLMASQGLHGPGQKRLMALDFSKAFLYGDMQRRVFIELPDEDGRKDGKSLVGLLRKSMYGLRDAPQIWQRVVQDMLKKRGFVCLVTTQCMYVNPLSGVIIVAHVDDFLCFGDKLLLKELLVDLQKDFE